MRRNDAGREVYNLKADSAAFAAALQEHCNWFAAVPDSVFRRVLVSLPGWQYAPRENHAIAMAFGARLGGCRPCVLMQNSGLGLCVDALLGTFRLYGQGLLMVISNRGVLPWEEVQHREWGAVTTALLHAIGIATVEFDSEGLDGLRRAADIAWQKNEMIALLLQRGNLDE